MDNDNNRIIENINRSQVNVQRNNSRILNNGSVNAQRNEAALNRSNDPRQGGNIRLGVSVRSANVRRNPLDEDFSMLSNININTNEHVNNRLRGNNENPANLNLNNLNNTSEDVPPFSPNNNEVGLQSRNNYVSPSQDLKDIGNEENTQIKNNENINSNAAEGI